MRYQKGTLFSPYRQGQAYSYVGINRGDGARGLYAHGYFATAGLVAKLMIENTAPVDTAIYPVVFLYRHAVELSLKQLLDDFDSIVRRPARKKFHHELANLWSELRPQLESHEFHDVARDAVVETDAILADLVVVDPDGQAGRYDRTTKGTESAINGFDTINIDVFYKSMELVQENFSAWLWELDEERSFVESARRERGESGPGTGRP